MVWNRREEMRSEMRKRKRMVGGEEGVLLEGEKRGS
jgi:hypothetical protein